MPEVAGSAPSPQARHAGVRDRWRRGATHPARGGFLFNAPRAAYRYRFGNR